MKYLKIVILAAAVAILLCVLPQPAHASLSFDVAYSNLNEHGSWLVSAQYGRVWQPREYNQGWNPYNDGRLPSRTRTRRRRRTKRARRTIPRRRMTL